MEELGLVVVFIFIMALAALFGFGLGGSFIHDKEITPLIRECEKSLPRDQNCELIAVVVKEGETNND